MSNSRKNVLVTRRIWLGISVLALILLTAVLSGCGTQTASTGGTTVAATPSASFSLDGTWNTNPEFMRAVISNGTIEINIVDTDTAALYWKGTWPATSVTDGSEITSDADVEALSASLMGSQEVHKTFTYKNGEITFSFSMLGVTKTVHLQK